MAKLNLRTIEQTILDGKELTDDEEEHLKKRVSEFWDDHPDVDNRFARWKKYIAWVSGYQLYDYNKYSKKLIEVPLKRKTRIIFNRLRPFVRQLVAKLSSDIPSMSVIPKTTDDEDIEAARVGDKIVESISDKVGLNNILRSVKLWSVVTNRCYLRVFWNEDDYGVIGYEDKDIEDEETGEVIDTEIEEITEPGDVGLECVSPFNCRVDPLYWDRNKWRWFLFGEEVDALAIEEEYDLKENSLQEESQTLQNAYDLELYDDHEIVQGATSSDSDVVGRTVVFKEFWTPRIWVFLAGKEVLDYGINKHREIPFFDIEDRLIPISNYGKGFQYNESLIKDAIPIQREYNRNISLISTAIGIAAKLKVLIPFGSLMSKKQWTNDYGTFIDYNPRMGGKPEQMRLDPLPAYVQQYKGELEREFETSLGVREASFGRLPERASHASGTLVNLLLEQDDILLNPLLSTINDALSKAWSLMLRIVRDNYGTPRIIRFVGEDGRDSVTKFMGADLKGNTDVKVISQSGLPRSRALRIEYIMKLREAGLLIDDKNTLEMLEFAQADKI